MILYLLTNTVNGKVYVGKTVRKNLNAYLSVKRWQAKNGNPGRMPVVNAIAKYGWDKFEVRELCRCADSDTLNAIEKQWIKDLDARNPEKGYNVCEGGGLGRLGLKNSKDHNQKIGAANKGRKPKGYVRTEKHRQQIRDRMQGNNRGVKFTKDSALRLAASLTPEQRKAKSVKMHEARRLKKESRVAIF